MDGRLNRVGVDEGWVRDEFRGKYAAVSQRQISVVVVEMAVVQAPIVVGISTAAAGWSWILILVFLSVIN